MADSKKPTTANRKKKAAAKRPKAKSRASAGDRGVPPQSEAFRDQLGSMETFLDEALREAGGAEDVSAEDGPLFRAAETFLDSYARLGRTLEDSSLADALSSASDRMRGDPNDYGYDTDFERTLLPLLRFLYRRWWRIEATGIERIPDDGPVVLVANHSGSVFAYDGAMLRLAVAEHHPQQRPVRPLLDASVCDLPVLGDVMARCGGVAASESNAEQLLSRGAVVASFPEGDEGFTRSFRHRYELGDFGDGGFVRAALRSGAAILPVAIVGAEEVHPALGRLDGLARRLGVPTVPLTPTFPWLGLGGLLPLPSRWRIEVGRPIRGLEKMDAAVAEDVGQVGRLTKRIRGRVQALVDSAVERRGRAFL